MDGLVASWPRCPSREPVWERSAGKLHALRGRQLFRPSREEAHPGVLQGDQGICIVWVGLEGEPLRHLGGRFSCAGCACFFFSSQVPSGRTDARLTNWTEPFKVLVLHLLAASASASMEASLGGVAAACLATFSMARVYQTGETLKGGFLSRWSLVDVRAPLMTEQGESHISMGTLLHALLWRKEAYTGDAAVPQAVCQHDDSEWKLVQSKKRWRKAATLYKQDWSYELGADRKAKFLLRHISRRTAPGGAGFTNLDTGSSGFAREREGARAGPRSHFPGFQRCLDNIPKRGTPTDH